MDSTILSLARSNMVLGELSPSTVGRLLQEGQTVEIPPQAVLVRQGDFSSCAYLILDGELEVQVETAYGSGVPRYFGRGNRRLYGPTKERNRSGLFRCTCVAV
ncbi:MAG TPA: hypothetical protein VIY68_21265 [Steroidobacteraceae bacterium]